MITLPQVGKKHIIPEEAEVGTTLGKPPSKEDTNSPVVVTHFFRYKSSLDAVQYHLQLSPKTFIMVSVLIVLFTCLSLPNY